MKKIIFIILTHLTTINLVGQSFHEEVKSLFNFTPHKLSKDEQQKIFPKLDKFFNKVISNKDYYIDSLRIELKSNDHNPYFYFDGGVLLMEISKELKDLQLVADALTKVDLRDLPRKMYLQHILGLSIKGANVIDAGLHIFSDPTFQVYIVEHAFLLNQGESLKFILPRYESELYVDKLISLYQKSNSKSMKINIVELLYYSRNCKADNFLSDLIRNKKEPKDVKDLIKKIENQSTKKAKSNPNNYNEIREKIKISLTRISDEAIYELNELTGMLTKNYKCDD